MTNEFSASPAWLIHAYPVRDNLLLVYILSQEQIIKGFYRVPKHKNLRILPQCFVPYHVIIRQKKDTINIQSLEPIGPAYMLKNLQLWLGMYLNELMFHLLRHEHHEGQFQFFKLYEAIIASSDPCPESLIREFEYYLLQDCGFGLDFFFTADGHAIDAVKKYQYTAGHGFAVSEDGYLGAELLQIADGQFNIKALKPILRQTIDMVLDGKILNSRELLRQWLTKQQAI
jgi:DNA repair protein RecO (recombination protein O)